MEESGTEPTTGKGVPQLCISEDVSLGPPKLTHRHACTLLGTMAWSLASLRAGQHLQGPRLLSNTERQIVGKSL